MVSKLIAHGPEAVRFLQSRIPGFQPEGNAIGFVCKEGEDPIGAVVYDSIGDRDASIHFAVAPGAVIVRKHWVEALSYPFFDLGLTRVTGWIKADNDRALSIAERLGFKREGIKRQGAADGGDLVMLGLVSTTTKD